MISSITVGNVACLRHADADVAVLKTANDIDDAFILCFVEIVCHVVSAVVAGDSDFTLHVHLAFLPYTSTVGDSRIAGNGTAVDGQRSEVTDAAASNVKIFVLFIFDSFVFGFY